MIVSKVFGTPREQDLCCISLAMATKEHNTGIKACLMQELQYAKHFCAFYY